MIMLAKFPDSSKEQLLLTEREPEWWEGVIVVALFMLLFLFGYMIVANLTHADPLGIIQPAPNAIVMEPGL